MKPGLMIVRVANMGKIRLLPISFRTSLTAPLSKNDSIVPLSKSDEAYILSYLPEDNDYSYILVSSNTFKEEIRVTNTRGVLTYSRSADAAFRGDFPRGSCVSGEMEGPALADLVCNLYCCEETCADEDPCNKDKITGLSPNIGDDAVPCGEAMNTTCDVPVKEGCEIKYYPNKCGYPVKATHINAIVSELLNIIKALGGTYDCHSVDNVAKSIIKYIQAVINKLIEMITNGDIDISNALKCIKVDMVPDGANYQLLGVTKNPAKDCFSVKRVGVNDIFTCVQLPEAKPTDRITPVGVVKLDNGCSAMRRITFPQTVSNRIMIAVPSEKDKNGNPIPFVLDIPDTASMITVKLQAGGGAGGVYNNSGRAESGGDSFLYLDGNVVLQTTGGESGYGGMGDEFPITASGGVGLVRNPEFVYSSIVMGIYSGSGKRDWLESTCKKAGGLGDGGKSIGPYGRNGLQTGCFRGDTPPLSVCDLSEEEILRNWQTLCGQQGGGGGGGNVTGCQWGSGGGAGGFCEAVIKLTDKNGNRVKQVSAIIGAGAESLGQVLPRGKGGDGYIEILW